MTSCRWCFTVNNPKDTDHVTLSTLDCKYMIYAEETAPTTGTLHLQGYVVLSSPCRLSKMKKILPPGTHIEAAKGTTEQNIEYCSKEGWPVEYGTRPKTRAQIGEDNAARYADAIQAAKEGRMDDIPPDLRTKHYNTYKNIAKDYMPKPDSLAQTCGLWIYGPTGTGKTHAVVTAFPDRYMKPLNKWWDGYQGEDVVHLDEIAPSHAQWIAPYLKKWADKWPFDAESKGSAAQLRPEKIIVTSNYSIDQMVFAEEDLDAIKRRYTQVFKYTREQTILLL